MFSQHISLYGKVETFKCYFYNSEVGTFDGLFESSTTPVYTLVSTSNYMRTYVDDHICMYMYATCKYIYIKSRVHNG